MKKIIILAMVLVLPTLAFAEDMGQMDMMHMSPSDWKKHLLHIILFGAALIACFIIWLQERKKK